MENIMAVKIIVALDVEGGYAKDHKIPWNIPEDFKHFMKTTKGAICLCGRNTYEEMLSMKKARLKEKYKSDSPILVNRKTYVVSKSLTEVDGAVLINNVSESIKKLITESTTDIFILGGESVFKEALPYVSEVILTVIPKSFNCDQFFPVEQLETEFVKNSGSKLQTKNDGELLMVNYIRVTK